MTDKQPASLAEQPALAAACAVCVLAGLLIAVLSRGAK